MLHRSQAATMSDFKTSSIEKAYRAKLGVAEPNTWGSKSNRMKTLWLLGRGNKLKAEMKETLLVKAEV